MKTRAITGVFFVVLMLASVLLGPFVYSGFYLLLATGCLFEFYTLFSGERKESESGFLPHKRLGIVLGFFMLAWLILVQLGIISDKWTVLLFMIVPVLLIRQLYLSDTVPFGRIAGTVLGFVYVTVPFYCFFLLGFVKGEFNGLIPMGFLLILWANDTGAYLIGKSFGRNKLFERISPKKTWEGFVGGGLAAIMVGIILFNQTDGLLPLWQWLVVAGLIAVVGTLGDLVESLLKRSLDVKDSGSLLPGHGGLLDRFDGLLLAAPIVYLFLLLLS